jgi:transposase
MKPYSLDLRERIVRAVDEGRSRAEIMEVFGVSKNTLKRYLKRWKETGDLVPLPIPGRPPKKRDAVVATVLPQLEANFDVTLEEHCRLFKAEQGLGVSPSTMSRAIQKLGWSRKKRRCLPQNKMKRHERVGVSKPAHSMENV